MLLLLMIVLFVSGRSMTGTNVDNHAAGEKLVEKQPIRLGYCPSMSGIAEEIATKNSHVSLVPYDFTAQALQSLNNKEVDAVLVGRLAEKSEIGETFERRLRDGLTLVGREKRLISIDGLQRGKIHTYVGKEQAQEYISRSDNVIFHDSFESAIKDGINDVVLIRWSDFSEGLELVIPVDDDMDKIEKFRIPVLYSYDEVYIKNLEV